MKKFKFNDILGHKRNLKDKLVNRLYSNLHADLYIFIRKNVSFRILDRSENYLCRMLIGSIWVGVCNSITDIYKERIKR